jgi:DNA-binding response OmpR family regulator
MIERPTMRAQHVYVVDDDPAVRLFAVTTLRAAGYQVTEAADGDTALRDLTSAGADMVLLDVRMPTLDGFEVCRRIRAIPALADLPVMILTALDRAEDIVAGIEAGADEFVTKPVEAPVLRARVAALLRACGRRPRQSEPQALRFPELLESRVQELARTANLTQREREVLWLQLLGRTVDDIAVALGITPRTARFHTSNVLDKIGADTRLDLFRILLAS